MDSLDLSNGSEVVFHDEVNQVTFEGWLCGNWQVVPLYSSDAIAAARAILKHFGEGLE